MGEFCYWEAKSSEDCFLVYFNILVTLGLAAITVRLVRQGSRKYRKRVRAVYGGVALWIVTNLAKDIFSVAVFHGVVQQDNFSERYSQIFAIIDTPPALVVQTLFLGIAYTMWKNVLRLMDRMQIQRTIEEQEFLNFMTFYIVIRVVILFLPWIALIIVPVSRASAANSVKLAMQLIDSLISNVLLVGSLKSFIARFEQIELDSPQAKRALKIQYSLMVLCSSLRFLIDLGFLIVLPQLHDTECIAPIKHHLYFSLGYTLFGTALMHFLPIGLVIYMYKPVQ